MQFLNQKTFCTSKRFSHAIEIQMRSTNERESCTATLRRQVSLFLHGAHKVAATLSAMISGHATAEGTSRYSQRFPAFEKSGHFRHPENVPGAHDLWLSSIGLGTYLG